MKNEQDKERPKSEILMKEMLRLQEELFTFVGNDEEAGSLRDTLKPLVVNGSRMLYLSAEYKQALQIEQKLNPIFLGKALIGEQGIALYMTRRLEPYVNQGSEIQGYNYALESMRFFHSSALEAGRALNELLITELKSDIKDISPQDR